MNSRNKYIKKDTSLPTHNKIIKLNTFSSNEYLQFFEMCLKLKNIQIDSITIAKEKNKDIIVKAYIPTNKNEFGEFKLLHFTYKFNDITASCTHSDFIQPDSFSPFWCAFCLCKLGQDYLTIWRESNNLCYNKQLTNLEDDIKYFSVCRASKEQKEQTYNYPTTIPFKNYYEKIDKKLALIESKKTEIISKKTKEELNLIKWSQNIATRLGEEAQPVYIEFENTPALSLVK